MSLVLYGGTTRGLYEAWHSRVGSALTLPKDEIQPLFNAISLFPSKSQVYEMLHCARQCNTRQRGRGRRRNRPSEESSGSDHQAHRTNSTDAVPVASSDPPTRTAGSEPQHAGVADTDQRVGGGQQQLNGSDDAESFLTFGEFCVYATELRKYYCLHEQDPDSVPTQPIQVSKLGERRVRGGLDVTVGTAAQGPVGGSTSTVVNPAVASGTPGAGPVGAGAAHQPAVVGGGMAGVVGGSGAVGSCRGELRTQRSTTSVYDVFLGGSCNPTTWRQDMAIPHLKSHAITFYNPQQANWVPEMIELEHQAKYSSQILLFVLNQETRNIVSMLEVSHFAGTNRKLLVVLSRYPAQHLKIGGELVSKIELEELETGMDTVQDLMERQGLPVFANIQAALGCTVKVLKDNLNIDQLGLADSAQPVRFAHLPIGDKLVRLREAFDTLDTSGSGRLTLAEICMAFRIHVNRDLNTSDLRAICSSHGVNVPTRSELPLQQIHITFDEFCSLVSEYKSRINGGGAVVSTASPGWLTTPFPSITRQDGKRAAGALAAAGDASSGADDPLIANGKDGGARSAGQSGSSKAAGSGRKSKTGKRSVGNLFSNLVQPVVKAVGWFSGHRSSNLANSASVRSNRQNYQHHHRTGSHPVGDFTTSAAVGGTNESVGPAAGGKIYHLLAGRRGSAIRDVYLGGAVTYTCRPPLDNRRHTASSRSPTNSFSHAATGAGPTDWRERLAIPYLKKCGLTFYNPAVFSSRRLIPIEASAMDNSRVLLFVITNESRCLAAMCQASYFIGLGCAMVLCVQHLGPDTVIDGEKLSPAAIKDYNRGRSYLSDFANREGIPVFDDISEALHCVVQKCKQLGCEER